jgi:hypothetical protein
VREKQSEDSFCLNLLPPPCGGASHRTGVSPVGGPNYLSLGCISFRRRRRRRRREAPWQRWRPTSDALKSRRWAHAAAFSSDHAGCGGGQAPLRFFAHPHKYCLRCLILFCHLSIGESPKIKVYADSAVPIGFCFRLL